jgi:hypothetical protein
VHLLIRNSSLYARGAFAVVALLSIAISSAWAEEQTVAVEVNYLINAVSESGCNFVRNGKEHTSSEAVDHLQMKARRGKRYYDTADEFIDRIASKSSWSGKPYQIQCDGQPAVTAAKWFTRVLTEYRARPEEA